MYLCSCYWMILISIFLNMQKLSTGFLSPRPQSAVFHDRIFEWKIFDSVSRIGFLLVQILPKSTLLSHHLYVFSFCWVILAWKFYQVLGQQSFNCGWILKRSTIELIFPMDFACSGIAIFGYMFWVFRKVEFVVLHNTLFGFFSECLNRELLIYGTFLNWNFCNFVPWIRVFILHENQQLLFFL